MPTHQLEEPKLREIKGPPSTLHSWTGSEPRVPNSLTRLRLLSLPSFTQWLYLSTYHVTWPTLLGARSYAFLGGKTDR